jgi:DNA-directed RNA polymerase subunit RPC12/RpoP
MREIGMLRLPRVDVGSTFPNLSDEVLEADGYTCPSDRCGKAFSEPLKLTNLSQRPQEETYYACPFCFSKVDVPEILMEPERSDMTPNIEPVISASPSKQRRNEKISDEEKATVSECPHQFGYLKSRSKGAEIPDQCLTCAKILQCMSST